MADRLEQARQRLTRSLITRPPGQDLRWRERADDAAEPTAFRTARRAELDALGEQASRALGRPAFNAPVDLARLRVVLGGGTAVMINVSHLRCDALLINDGGIHVLRLPALTPDTARAAAERYAEANRAFVAGLRGEHPPAMMRANKTMSEVLAWLWETVAGPIIAAVTRDGQPRPRIWWCPTGPLTLLPLHAAGTDRACVTDQVVSSYTVTFGHLCLAADRQAAATARPLVATASALPGLPKLVGPDRDAAVLDTLLSPPPVRLDGREVTRDRLLMALATHPVVHIAGHGGHDPDSLNTGLHLADGPLTFQDIISDRARSDLVFLAACHTAVTGTRLPDEGTHLAAVLQLAGVRHVIATLWQVADHDTFATTHTAAELVYTNLVENGEIIPTNAAHAVDSAVRTLRENYPHEPSMWAPYLHFGP